MSPITLTTRLLPLFATLVALPVAAAGLRVDINNNARPLGEGQDPSFTPWSEDYIWFPGGDSTSQTFDGVTVTFTRVGGVGSALRPSYWKAGVQSTEFDVRLTGDGIMVDDGDAGAQIEMRIAGLTPGEHSVLLYLNNWDGGTSLPAAPLDISVDGSPVINDLAPSNRVENNADATTAYLEFTASSGTDVVILVAAELGGSYTTRNVRINGFEIDTENTDDLATSPVPADGDIHADVDTGSTTLQWTAAASGADSHDVYFGTDEAAVEAATPASPEFMGNQAGTSHPVSGLDSFQPYFWRIDQVSGATTTKGNVWSFRPRRLAFPGAEGYGRFAQGGRGGAVVKVTNLNDSGPGSLRDAVKGDHGPRTVIFDVSGLITLNSDIIINGDDPPITIAGQTAPGKGICIKREQFAMSGAEDIVMRFVRGLVGKESGATQNATGMAGVNHCIMDHCSFGWGIDEGLSTRGAFNVTFQRCSLSEALNIAGHSNYGAGTRHGYAASVGGDIASLHHNLLAHNEGRNWSLAGGLDGDGFYAGRLDIFNNVVYNWRGRTTDGGAHEVNFVNNYYKRGPVGGITTLLNPQYGGFPGTQQYYMAGNVLQDGASLQTNQSALLDVGTENGGTLPQDSSPPYSATVGAPFFPSHATIHSATNAYKQVLSDVGCNLPMVDDRDARIIGETLAGSHTHSGSVSGDPGLPDTTADVGGWEDYGNEVRAANWDSDDDGMPDWWEVIHGFNPASAAGDFSESNGDQDGDQYTNLEEYLNWMAVPHVDCNHDGTVDVDLSALSRGYTASPGFVVNNVVNGTVSLIGGDTARFTPTTSANALGKFEFTVTDSAGDSMTREVGVRIIGSGSTPLAPPAPADLVATPGDGSVSLVWSPSAGADDYRVKRSTTDGSGYATIASPATTSFADTTVSNGTTYYYIVTAVNTGGESPDSAQAVATPSGPGSSDPVTLQVEEADSLGGGVSTETEHGGNGSGYVNFPTSGGFAEFQNVDGGPGGTGTLTVRFALGNDARSGLLVVNGNSEPITFPGTGAWNNWQTLDVPVTLNPGAVNTIRFETNGEDLANLDEITIQPALAAVEVSITASDDSAGEFGADQALEFSVTRSGSTTAALVVPLVAGGSATAGEDYSGFTGSVEIPAGQASAPVALTVLADALAEGSETVQLSLGASGEFTAGTPSTASATILDKPSQDEWAATIADPAKRGANDDGDGDLLVNLLEYYMGTDAGDAGSRGVIRIESVATGSFTLRFPLAAGRDDVSGQLLWSTDLGSWQAGGVSDGSRTITFSAPSPVAGAEDPNLVEVTATITGDPVNSAVFVQLEVVSP